jgi:hypothetical protein
LIGVAVKTYRPALELKAAIKHLLESSTPSFHGSPLKEVLDLLCTGRNYSWAGIHLVTGADISEVGHHPEKMALPESRTKILVTIKLASHEFGVLAVESDLDHGIGPQDRVLLEQVAGSLARFFAGPGKYIVRKAAMPRSISGSAASA